MVVMSCAGLSSKESTESKRAPSMCKSTPARPVTDSFVEESIHQGAGDFPSRWTVTLTPFHDSNPDPDGYVTRLEYTFGRMYMQEHRKGLMTERSGKLLEAYAGGASLSVHGILIIDSLEPLCAVAST